MERVGLEEASRVFTGREKSISKTVTTQRSGGVKSSAVRAKDERKHNISYDARAKTMEREGGL